MACTQAWSPDAKQGLFEMLIMGRKGREREEKRSFFTAESLYIMLFCLSLQTECSCGGDSAYSNDGKHWRLSASKQIVATNSMFTVITTSSVVLFIWIIFLLDPPWLLLFYLSGVSQTLCILPLQWRGSFYNDTNTAAANHRIGGIKACMCATRWAAWKQLNP